MTKNQEIEILLEAAVKLGDNSYCGPWLTGIAEEVRAEIRSDFMPSPCIWLAEKQCADIRKNAKDYADALILAATTTADKIRTEARSHANTIIEGAIANLRDAKFN